MLFGNAISAKSFCLALLSSVGYKQTLCVCVCFHWMPVVSSIVRTLFILYFRWLVREPSIHTHSDSFAPQQFGDGLPSLQMMLNVLLHSYQRNSAASSWVDFTVRQRLTDCVLCFGSALWKPIVRSHPERSQLKKQTSFTGSLCQAALSLSDVQVTDGRVGDSSPCLN